MANNVATDSMNIDIEVVYALPYRQYYYYLTLPARTTARQAILATNLLVLRPEIDLKQNSVGIYSQFIDLDTQLKQGDRLEIYRPITANPKELRLRRLEKKKIKN